MKNTISRCTDGWVYISDFEVMIISIYDANLFNQKRKNRKECDESNKFKNTGKKLLTTPVTPPPQKKPQTLYAPCFFTFQGPASL